MYNTSIMLPIILIIVQYNNDTMLHSLYPKRMLLDKSSNNTSQGFLVAINLNYVHFGKSNY